MRPHRNAGYRISHWGIAAVLLSVFVAGGCDFLDPTNVNNPNPTAEDLASASEPTRLLLPGLRAQTARAVAANAVINEFVTDNWERTFSSVTGELDDPHVVNPDGGTFNSTGAWGGYWHLQELRALSDFVLNEVAPEDPDATDGLVAEAHYRRGLAFLMQGENYIGVPIGRDEAPTPWDELLELARQDFEQARSLVGPGDDLAVDVEALLARTFRALGDAQAAVEHANSALALDPNLVAGQEFSAGEIEPPRLDRPAQPLPRLDFLDPKYSDRSSAMALAKAEEMHFILAEAAMAQGDYDEGASRLAAAVEIASTRPTREFNDPDLRLNLDVSVRPRDSEILVRADPESPLRAGLIQDRPGPVTVHYISGTSLDADSLAALTDPGDIRHALWLARQEVLYLEGRRLHDLGVRLPVAARDIDPSPAIDWGDPVTEPQVPTYIEQGLMTQYTPRSPYRDPSAGGELATNEITIAVDMNRVLAEERVSAFGTLP